MTTSIRSMAEPSRETHRQQESSRLPDQDDTLPLAFDFKATVESSGARVLCAISAALDASGKRGDNFAADLELDPAQLSRALNGRGAHFSVRWLPAVLWRDREHRVIRALCAIAGGEFVPKPKRSREDENESVRQYVEKHLGELGLDVLKRAIGEEP